MTSSHEAGSGRRTVVTAAAVLLLVALVAADAAAQTAIATAVEQIRLARSAAPAHLRDSATVYVLGANGYETAAAGTNGFHCLLERWEIDNVTPICYDRVGAESTLRVVFYLEKLRASGVPDSTALAEIERGYADGTFRAPAAPGVAYMLSLESPAPPHVMYYAPYATNHTFGGATGAARAVLPFVYDAGSPRACIVQLVNLHAMQDLEKAGR